MNIDKLVPSPSHCEPFNRRRRRFVPEKPGCYVLTTFLKVVLYIGLADNLRRRMTNHLDDPKKTNATKSGRAVLFFWIEGSKTRKVERTWMNIHNENEGRLPELNRIYSPTAT
jgi:hypothetical protein